MSEANARFKIRNGSGHSPATLLPSELGLRTDTLWLYYGESDQSPNILYGQNVIPLERPTLSAHYQLSLQNKRYQFIDPDGSDWDVILPIQTVTGLIFHIRNVNPSNTLTIKEGSTPIGTLGYSTYNDVKDGLEGIFIFDGVNWEVTFFG